MTEKYKGKHIMISKGMFTQGQYGKYSVRGEILHMADSYVFGNNEDEVLAKLKSYIDLVCSKKRY